MRKIIAEFKEFALKGNMIDLAIGVVLGQAFNGVVNSIVKDIFTPIIGIIMGGKDFSNLSITVGESSIMYGALIQAFINFLVVAVSLFVLVKVMNALRRKREELKEEKVKEEEPLAKPADIELLEEIRDLLKEQ